MIFVGLGWWGLLALGVVWLFWLELRVMLALGAVLLLLAVAVALWAVSVLAGAGANNR